MISNRYLYILRSRYCMICINYENTILLTVFLEVKPTLTRLKNKWGSDSWSNVKFLKGANKQASVDKTLLSLWPKKATRLTNKVFRKCRRCCTTSDIHYVIPIKNVGGYIGYWYKRFKHLYNTLLFVQGS